MNNKLYVLKSQKLKKTIALYVVNDEWTNLKFIEFRNPND